VNIKPIKDSDICREGYQTNFDIRPFREKITNIRINSSVLIINLTFPKLFHSLLNCLRMTRKTLVASFLARHAATLKNLHIVKCSIWQKFVAIFPNFFPLLQLSSFPFDSANCGIALE
jgi:hypothetical protein